MKTRHSIHYIINMPLIPGKNDIEMDEFVMKPKTHQTEPAKSKETTTEETAAFNIAKTTFLPSEIDQLPIRSIYSTEVRCGVCFYGTKVRTNLIRHLQLHVEEKYVSNSAPVNPVPCLDKNEKMFDKMTNLAISSFSSGMSRMGGSKAEAKGEKEVAEDFPAYVPPHRRFVCGANNCNYLCLEESNLRHHLLALHDEETSFTCTHCKKQLDTDADGVLKHLKLHDLHLYKCSHCTFIHNLKHKIERHVIDHKESNVKMVTLRALDAPPPVESENQPDSLEQELPATPPSVSSKWSKPWRCSMCKHRTTTKEDIMTHVLNKHEIDSQFKCILCTFKSNDDKTFPNHFKEHHPGHEIDIIMVFHKTDDQRNLNLDSDFDTTPLWLRDKPRVRHIRGILLDDVSPVSKKKINFKPVAPVLPPSVVPPASSIDSAIDAVVKGTADVMKSPPPGQSEDIFDRINKTLADSKNDIILAKQEQVISISDSDDDDLIIIDQPPVRELQKSEIIDIETVSKVCIPNVFTKEEDLIREYGPLGSPLSMQFSCPRCNNFKTKKIIDFIHHLFRDLNYKRYECMHCHLRSVTKSYVLNHIKKHELSHTTGLKLLSVNMEIYWWVEMVIRYQSSVIASQNPVPIPLHDNITSNECRFCKERYSNSIDTHLHEVRHWMEKSLHCSVCTFKCDLKEEMKHHFATWHPTSTVNYQQDLAPTVIKYIEMCEDDGKVTIDLSKIDQQPSTPTKVDAGIHFYCLYCYWKSDNSDDVKSHWVEKHQAAGLEFKVKKSKTQDNTLLSCEYCNTKGLENELKHHHEMAHPQQEFKVYKFKCPLCSQLFRRIDYFRSHGKKMHGQQYLNYVNIYGETVKQDNSVSYTCPVCKHTAPSTGAFRGHVRMHCRPFQCKMCNNTYKHRHDAVQHFQKDHPHSPVSIDLLKDKIKEYDDICYKVLGIRSSMKALDDVQPEQGTLYWPRPSTDIKPNNCARKSTAGIKRPEREYSFYGCPVEPTDMKAIITTIEMNKSEVTMTAHQLNSFFNLSPDVIVKDCKTAEVQLSADELDL